MTRVDNVRKAMIYNMIQLNISKRPSYIYTLPFWETIDEYLSLHSNDETQYLSLLRDRAMFQLSYSYGVRVGELPFIKESDLCLDCSESDDSYGCVYVNSAKTLNRSNSARIIYPIFNDVIDSIKQYLNTRKLYLKHSNLSSILTIQNENTIDVSLYMKRLDFYNRKVAPSNRISNINTLRQFYISDIIRIKELPRTLVSKQIGSFIAGNPIYLCIENQEES